MIEEEFERLALNLLREAGHLRQPALEEGAAYRAGWEEGLFAPLEHSAPQSGSISLFEGMERLACCRGHRDGRRTRKALSSRAGQPRRGAALLQQRGQPPQSITTSNGKEGDLWI